MMTMLDHALALAARGFFIFPCRPNRKDPAVSGGWKAATTDPKQIKEWWVGNPTANIGLSPSQSGMFVIDADGTEGIETVEALLDIHGAPPTMMVATPNGGRHYYFYGDDIKTSAGVVAKHVDIRGYGGYVVAGGSSLDGRSYVTFDDKVEPAVAPPALTAACGWRGHPSTTREADAYNDNPETERQAIHYLEHLARPAIEGQGGNEQTYKVAAQLHSFGIYEPVALQLMDQWYNPRCEPPWDADELEVIVGNAYEYAQDSGGAKAPTPEATIVAGFSAIHAGLQAQAKRGTFRPLRWDEFMSLPDPRWVVEEMIQEKGLVMLFGPPETYKTFVALDLALHMALGKTWCGREIDKAMRVVYATAEGGAAIRQRVKAWVHVHNGGEPIENFMLLPSLPIFKNDAQFEKLLDDLAKEGAPDVFMVDTVSWAMAGLDENASQDASFFIRRLAAIRDRFDCTVLGVHHTGKAEKHGARGSNVLTANIDTVYRVASPGKNQTILHAVKQREAAKWSKSQGLQGEQVVYGTNTKGKDLHSLVFMPANFRETVEIAMRATAAVAILDALPPKAPPMSPSELARLVYTRITDETDIADVTGAHAKPIANWLRNRWWERDEAKPYIFSDDPLMFGPGTAVVSEDDT